MIYPTATSRNSGTTVEDEERIPNTVIKSKFKKKKKTELYKIVSEEKKKWYSGEMSLSEAMDASLTIGDSSANEETRT